MKVAISGLLRISIVAGVLSSLAASEALAAAPVEFASGIERVALVELYTSEGCSSCPPADRWLSRLESDAGLWTEFVPVALHVDYWNDIGWEDRFSRRRYSERQRRYAAEGGTRIVYTPGVFLNGRDWSGWRAGQAIADRTSGPGNLSLRVDGEDVVVRFSPAATVAPRLRVHVAVLGMDLETRVRAGENNGRTLHHDFVALGLASFPLEASDGVYRAVTTLPAVARAPARRAIAAWVSTRDSQMPIQAVGGYLPPG